MEKEINYQLNLSDWPVSDHGSVKKIMSRELNLSRKEISRLKYDGEILLNGERIKVNDHMRVGDTLTLRFPEINTEQIPVLEEEPEILYEDEDLVIINKPAGIPCHPVHGHMEDSAGTILASHYLKQGQEFVIRPVGRLDKDVSGVLIFAKSRLSAARLSKDRENDRLRKYYTAFAEGVLEVKQGIIDAPIARMEGQRRRETDDPDGKPAITKYRVTHEFHVNQMQVSALAVEIETGRTHQIRAHLSSIGHPLLGDELYGGNTEFLNRPALHCAEVDFLTPFSRQDRIVRAPLPDDMRELLEESAKAPIIEEVKEEPIVEAEETPRYSSWPPEEPIAEPAVTEEASGDRMRRILTVFLILILLTALGLLGWLFLKPGNETTDHSALYEQLNIEFKENNVVEYGGDFHPADYINTSYGEISWQGMVDTSILGSQTMVFTAEQKDRDGTVVKKEFEREFVVKDMIGPIISLDRSIVRISQGDQYDLESNILSVLDPVDGTLSYTLDTGSFNTAVPGTYIIHITTQDSSGNTASKSFKVIVEATAEEIEEEPPKETEEPEESPEPTPEPTPKDETAPIIQLSSESVTLTEGDAFSAGSLLVSVRDETDGDLSYAEGLTPGSYTVISDVDSDTPGSYTVTVIAVDTAGNRTEKTVSVIVKEAPTPEPVPSSSPTVSSVPNSSNPKEQIYNFLVNNIGLNRAQACGVLSNMHRESRFNSTADNGVGYYGLCQWGGDRLASLKSWCGENGYDYTTIDGQLHFLQWEMPLYYPNTTSQLRACPNDEEGARKASWIFAIGYEVAGEEFANMSMDKAAEYFNE
ncbi:MAG: RluA family pseudouridine synthase [Solobacterium sp.]|nr:RluA family pseudouridine synthase [Solobacterium sp.]